MNTQWNRESVIQLIELYEKKPVLWNPKDNNYYMKTLKQDAWEEIADKVKRDIEDVKQKMTSLLSSFRREKLKVKKGTGTGKGRDDIYLSTWFAFKNFRFLLDKDKPKYCIETEIIEETEEQDSNETFNDAGLVVAESQNQPEVNNDETLNIVEETTTPKYPKPFVSQKRKMAEKQHKDTTVAEAYGILKEISARNTTKDECSTFGDFICSKLRKFDNRVRAIVMYNMNNIIFNAEMGKYNAIIPQHSAFPLTQRSYDPTSAFSSSSESSQSNLHAGSSQYSLQQLQSVDSYSRSNSQSYQTQERNSHHPEQSPLQCFIEGFNDTT